MLFESVLFPPFKKDQVYNYIHDFSKAGLALVV